MYLSNLPYLLAYLPLLATATLSKRQNSTAPTVQLLNGSYYGVHSSEYSQDYFLGIPFAQPPTGDLRFRPPQPLNTTFNDTRNATEYSPQCIGYGSDTWVLGNYVSEDCLTVNIIRPEGVASDAKLPVGVWIYGGGNYNGGNSDPRYNASFIVKQSVQMRAPMIVVQLNYRLQAWGFLFGREVVDSGNANLGNRDQRLALQWVQENIAAFGGDSSKVTIWGESAGASGVGMQLLAYGGRDDGLFRAAIAQSGGPVASSRLLTPEQWQPYYNNITLAAGCSNSTDSLACLRTIPTQTLSNILNSTVTASAPWGPQIDRDFLQSSFTQSLLDGKFVRVPILQGRNHDEGTDFAARGINTTEQFLTNVRSLGPDNATALTIAALYPDIPAIGIPPGLSGRPTGPIASYGAQWKRIAAYVGDLRQHAPRRIVSQVWAKYNVTNYSYHFNVIPNGAASWLGSGHFREVAFVFDNTMGVGYKNVVAVDPFEGKGEEFDSLARMMSRMWVSFIVGGDPNDSGVSCVNWPKYTLDNPRNMVFDVNVTNLAYVEPDTYRAAGIDYISERFVDVYGR